MTETDRLLTRTIVGPVRQLAMGRPASADGSGGEGPRPPAGDPRPTLQRLWQDVLLVLPADDPAWLGRPRPEASGARRWLQRHALLLAATGWLLAVALAAVWLLHGVAVAGSN